MKESQQIYDDDMFNKEINNENNIEEIKQEMRSIVFDGCLYKTFKYLDKTWKIKTVETKKIETAYMEAKAYDGLAYNISLKLNIVSMALISINDLVFSSPADSYQYLKKLAIPIISKLYDEYYELIQKKAQLEMDLDKLNLLKDDNFSRLKYKVMRTMGCMPTEERVQNMNNAQWLWLYLNIQKDMEEERDIAKNRCDYLGMYINPKLAKIVADQNKMQKYQEANKNTDERTKYIADKIKNGKPGEVLRTELPQDGFVVNTEFEKELMAATKGQGIKPEDQKVIQLDENQFGNPYESEKDFLERVKAFEPYAFTNYGYEQPKKKKQYVNIKKSTKRLTPKEMEEQFKRELQERDKILNQNNDSNISKNNKDSNANENSTSIEKKEEFSVEEQANTMQNMQIDNRHIKDKERFNEFIELVKSQQKEKTGHMPPEDLTEDMDYFDYDDD